MHMGKTIFLCILLFLGAQFVSTPSVQAGMLSSVMSKVTTRKAAQRTAIQAAEKKAALTRARAAAQKAARQERQGLISRTERSRSDWAFDKKRDKVLPITHLTSDRKVYKYYVKANQARREMRQGIPAGRHMTATGPGQTGRPIEGKTAWKRYGLQAKPEARSSISLPKGTPVRQGKVVGGQRGYGEITPQRRIPSKNVGDLRYLN